MSHRATLHIHDDQPPYPSYLGTLIGVSVEIVRDGRWRAFDDDGHVVFDYWKDSAVLRCLALRLGFEDPGELKRT